MCWIHTHAVYLKRIDPAVVLFCGIILSASGLLSPGLALLIGITFGLTLNNPFCKETSAAAKFLLQASVVLLGFGMNFGAVVRTGRSGVAYTAISIAFAVVVGLTLGWLLRVKPKASMLITCGTAICGGSAIAAIAPVLQAGEDEMAVSLGTVFSLNAVALFLFPAVGWALHMSQSQFGLWAALGIHDTSSVVGAAAKYGQQALEIGTTVKLTRALWIIPVALLIAVFTHRGADAPENGDETQAAKSKIMIPWFIGLFVLAAIVQSYLPGAAPIWTKLTALGKTGLTTVLFLIGTGMTRSMLRNVGWRPMLQGVLLWIAAGSASLLAIRAGWITL